MNLYDISRFLGVCETAGVPVPQAPLDDKLYDESRYTGYADAWVRPTDAAQVQTVLTAANRYRIPVTTIAMQTSVTGASTPQGGVVLDLSGLTGVSPQDAALVRPGTILLDYKRSVEALGLFYPPDPTSQNIASIGGTVACNASGALSYLYGPTRDYVDGLQVVLPTGELIDIRRGDVLCRDDTLVIPASLPYPRLAHDIAIPLSPEISPSWRDLKSAAGLWLSKPMDLVDLFIGTEGLFGVIVNIRTRLLPLRDLFFSLMILVPDRRTIVALVQVLDMFTHPEREEAVCTNSDADLSKVFALVTSPAAAERLNLIRPACMEWFDAATSRLVSDRSAPSLYGRLYIEQEYRPGTGADSYLEQWTDFQELMADHGYPLEIEAAVAENQVRAMIIERRAVPELLNKRIRPGLTKAASDCAVPMRHLEGFLELHDALPEGRTYVFGHIGNAHLHANLMPDDADELKDFRAILKDLAAQTIAMGGTVSGEHGIGKLKKPLFELMASKATLDHIRAVKSALDPNMLLNRGNTL